MKLIRFVLKLLGGERPHTRRVDDRMSAEIDASSATSRTQPDYSSGPDKSSAPIPERRPGRSPSIALFGDGLIRLGFLRLLGGSFQLVGKHLAGIGVDKHFVNVL